MGGARARSARAAFSAARAFPGNQRRGAGAGDVHVSNVRPSSCGPFHPISAISSSPGCSWWCSVKPRVLRLFSLPAGGTKWSPRNPVATWWAAGGHQPRVCISVQPEAQLQPWLRRVFLGLSRLHARFLEVICISVPMRVMLRNGECMELCRWCNKNNEQGAKPSL